jgi:hypothetical protein
MESMAEQIRGHERGVKDRVESEVKKERDRYDTLLHEKDVQNKLNREAIVRLQDSMVKLSSNTAKSNSLKGSEGEKEFSHYAETFMDFSGYHIVDKHAQGGQGDFHMHFEEFDVLVDAKNYKKKVPIDQREKIKNDLIKNAHINFAWLVSLNTSIDKWDKAPIMYEWINTSQCIVYINNLAFFEEPHKILRAVWYTCKELFKLVEGGPEGSTGAAAELSRLRENEFKTFSKIKEMRKSIREMNTSINVTKGIVQALDEQLKGMIELEAKAVVTSNFSLFDQWWEQAVEKANDDSVSVVSTDLWTRYKQDNKSLVKEMEISVDQFKQYIKSKVPCSSLVVKSKNANSAFEVRGFLLKGEPQQPQQSLDKEMVVEFHEKPAAAATAKTKGGKQSFCST